MLRGKDGKLFKLSDCIELSGNQEPIKIIKTGPRVKSPSHGWETSEPAIRAKASNKKQGNTLQGKHTRNRKRSKSSQYHDGERKVRVSWVESCPTTIDHICIVPKKGGESWNHYGRVRGGMNELNGF